MVETFVCMIHFVQNHRFERSGDAIVCSSFLIFGAFFVTFSLFFGVTFDVLSVPKGDLGIDLGRTEQIMQKKVGSSSKGF